MDKLGGLDCIAMAVEHLERVEESKDSPSPAKVPPPVPASHAPVVTVVNQFPTAAPVPRGNIIPQQAAFSQQPRIVTDAEDFEKESDDAMRIEELREMIFHIDLAEWKTLSAPNESAVVTNITQNDVLCGRGGETNHHKGNIVFRMCVKACQPAYIEAKRRDKPYIAQRIVLFVRKIGGRFLKRERDSAVDAWKDVGNNKAREKTSQALREGAPELRGDVKEPIPGKPTATSEYEMNLRHAVEYDRPGPPMYAVPPPFHPYSTASLHPSYRPAKKPRHGSSFYHSHGTAHYHPHVLPVAPMESYPMMHPHETSFSHIPSSPRVTVSADEEERSNPTSPTSRLVSRNNSSSSTSSMATHGPRLKLLKKRLAVDVNTQ